MVDEKNYKKYLNIKQKLYLDAGGMQYNKILASDILSVVYKWEKRIGYKHICKNFFSYKFFGDFKTAFRENDIVITNSIDRTDYLEQIALTIKNVGSVIHINLKNTGLKFTCNFYNILFSLWFVFKKVHRLETLRNWLFLAGKLAHYMNSYNYISRIFANVDLSGKKYVAFNSSYSFEALLCQFFSQRKAQTFSLSHSIYISYKSVIVSDFINGENITANMVLVWGQSSVDGLVKYFDVPKKNILVAGNPKYQFKESNIKKTFKSCIVLLGRLAYEQGNFKIIQIIQQLQKEENITFYLKLHPSLNVDIYREACREPGIKILEERSLTECFKKNTFDFAIANNSTAYYEAMYYDMICFRFEPDENDLFIGLDDKFFDAASLKKCILFFKSKTAGELNSMVLDLLINSLGIGINRYKEILESK